MIFSYYRAHQTHFQSTAQLFAGSFSLGATRVEGRRGEEGRGEEGDKKKQAEGRRRGKKGRGGRGEKEEAIRVVCWSSGFGDTTVLCF